MFKTKKAQYNLMSVVQVAIAFVIFGIVVGLCASLLTNVQTTSPDSVAALLIGNQSLTWAGNNTAIALNEKRIVTGSLLLYNNGSIVNIGSNYTVTPSSITLLNASPSGKVGSQSEWVTDKLNASYNYYYGSAARNQSGLSVDAIETLSSYQLLIAFAMIAAIIVGIILLYFRIRE